MLQSSESCDVMGGSENVSFIYTSKNLRIGREAGSFHTSHSSSVKQSSSGMLENTVGAIRIFLSSRSGQLQTHESPIGPRTQCFKGPFSARSHSKSCTFNSCSLQLLFFGAFRRQ